MIAATVSFTLGVLLVQQLWALPAPQWLGVGIWLTGFCLWLRYRPVAFFLAGLIWAAAFAHGQLNARLPAYLEGKTITVSGHIIGLPIAEEQRVRFDFAVQSGSKGVPSRLRLNWYYPKQILKTGQHWTLAVKLKRPHGSLNPGCFDYERWLFSEGIGATGYVRNKPAPVLLVQNSASWTISGWRQALSDALDKVMAGSPQRGVIKALTIGERHQLTAVQWTVFRQTGTVHLMAISGLHIGLIAGLVYFPTFRLWSRSGILRYAPQTIAALSALFAASLYAAMAGFSIPTQRALIMLAVLLLARIRQRNMRPFNALALALLAVLVHDPLALLSPGFWLSFLAVAVIAYAFSARLASETRWLAAARIHGVTALALAPLLVFFFQQVSLIAPLANLVAVPVVSLLVVPIALTAVLLLGFAPTSAAQLLTLAEAILQALDKFLLELAALPNAYLHLSSPSIAALLLAGLGLLLLLAPRGIPARGLGAVMLAPLIFTGMTKPLPGEVVLTLLDVGQGLSAVVQTAHHTLVFDTGARFNSGVDMGQMVLLPFLRHQGIGALDSLIVSHGDNDHSGGAASLLQAMPVTFLYTSVPKQLSPYAATVCSAGQTWVWDKVRFSMLAPGSQRLDSENDSSCVLKIESSFGSILLPADIERQGETWLVKTYGEQLRADILLAPHHGSKTSSIHAFLQAVKPAMILIPVGYKNRFGFPHQTVLQRYEAQHINWLSSAGQGAITVHLAKTGNTVESYRNKHGRYWHMKPGQ